MRRGYKKPLVEILHISCEDILTMSPGLSVEDSPGEDGGSIGFGEWLGNLTGGGIGDDQKVPGVDIGDVLS